MPTPRSEFLAGLQAELPLVFGVVPFGMIYGVLALEAGLSPTAAQSMSAVVFAGSAQFITARLLQTGAPLAIIVLTAVIVNLRHALYSASVAPHIQKLRASWKWLLAYLLTDEAFAVTILHYQRTPETQDSATDGALAGVPGGGADHRHWFFLGAGLMLWTSWQVSTFLGIRLGAVLPASWPLDFALALTFIALVVPALRDRAGVAAALSAGIAALLTASWPLKLGLLFSTLLGIGVGLWLEKHQ
jgi:predicted branched-subunit amino acid permease